MPPLAYCSGASLVFAWWPNHRKPHELDFFSCSVFSSYFPLGFKIPYTHLCSILQAISQEEIVLSAVDGNHFIGCWNNDKSGDNRKHIWYWISVILYLLKSQECLCWIPDFDAKSTHIALLLPNFCIYTWCPFVRTRCSVCIIRSMSFWCSILELLFRWRKYLVAWVQQLLLLYISCYFILLQLYPTE